MSQSVRVETGELGGSALSRAAQEGSAPLEWYPTRPRALEAWRQRLAAVRDAAPAGWYHALLPAMAPTAGSRAAERLERVADGRGIVVTTGQQPGLFGGPLYTWTKALSALALADALEAATGIPVAPVFWAATDDSDIAEASWTVLATANGAERIQAPFAAAEGTRMADVPLPDLSPLLDRVERAAGSAADHRPLELLRRTWGQPTTVGAAYVALLRGLLEPLGITVLDSAQEAVSIASHGLLVRALHDREHVARALASRSKELRAAGHEPQVADLEELTLVFERHDGTRRRVPMRAGAVAAASAVPGSLSPNVLLRPVMERAILPTVAYVAGPAEIAYFAQVSAVAEALGQAQPLALPRWSASLVEPEIDAILARHGLSTNDFAVPDAVEGRMARAAWPGSLSAEMASLRRALADGLGRVRSSVTSVELVAPAVLEGAARSMDWRLARLERRISAAVKHRESELMRELARARGALYPEGVRQERMLNLIPLLARRGTGLLAEMASAASGHARGLVDPEGAPGSTA